MVNYGSERYLIGFCPEIIRPILKPVVDVRSLVVPQRTLSMPMYHHHHHHHVFICSSTFDGFSEQVSGSHKSSTLLKVKCSPTTDLRGMRKMSWCFLVPMTSNKVMIGHQINSTRFGITSHIRETQPWILYCYAAPKDNKGNHSHRRVLAKFNWTSTQSLHVVIVASSFACNHGDKTQCQLRHHTLGRLHINTHTHTHIHTQTRTSIKQPGHSANCANGWGQRRGRPTGMELYQELSSCLAPDPRSPLLCLGLLQFTCHMKNENGRHYRGLNPGPPHAIQALCHQTTDAWRLAARAHAPSPVAPRYIYLHILQQRNSIVLTDHCITTDELIFFKFWH